jgi:ferric-dicitrate binding protein FerR (iron transport regulator)
LGDGTRVYLNASSSLRFPARFDASSREVFLSGEAYFEVTGDGRPFHVVTGDGPRVTVYGTSFNVNTRPSRGTRIVLVSGRIGVRGPRDTTERFLSPSRMIEYDGEGVFRSEREVNASLYTAWMKGRFVFRDESLEEVMEVLCRWYNVEVTYETPGLKGYHLTGDIEKYGEIDVILDAISRVVGVTFERRERSITVKEQAGWPGTL